MFGIICFIIVVVVIWRHFEFYSTCSYVSSDTFYSEGARVRVAHVPITRGGYWSRSQQPVIERSQQKQKYYKKQSAITAECAMG